MTAHDQSAPSPEAALNADIDDAMHMHGLGGSEAAFMKLQQVLERARQQRLREVEARALLGLSHVLKWVPIAGNSFVEGEGLAREALAIYTELGNAVGIAKCNIALAPHAGSTGTRMLEDALALFRNQGDREQIAHVLERLAAHMALRDRPRARGLQLEALAIYEELDDAVGQGNVLFGLSIGEMQDRAASRDYAERALEQYRRANRPKQVAQMCMFLDDLEMPAAARIPGLLEGIRAAADTNTFIWQASMMRSLADCYVELGRIEEAEELRRQADDISPEDPLDEEEMKAFTEALESGDPDQMFDAIKAWGSDDEQDDGQSPQEHLAT